MSKIALVFDSSADIGEKAIKDVYVLPLAIIEEVDGKQKTFKDGVDISTNEMLKGLKDGRSFKTSQTVPADAMSLFDKLSAEYEQVFVFPIPKTLSGNYNSLKLFAQEYKNISVFEQPMVAGMMRFTIIDLLEKIKNGEISSEKDVEKYLKDVEKKRMGAVVVSDMSYLVKGGRVSAAKGMFAKLFGIIAVLTLDYKGLNFYDKTTKEANVPTIIADAFTKCIKYKPENVKRVCILTSGMSDEKFNMSVLEKLIKEKFVVKDAEVFYGKLPSIIAAHVGPNYLVIGIDLK
jgi:DegV family protein with EDD domain